MPGFNWLQIMIIGRKRSPTLAHQIWWTTREEKKRSNRELESKTLRKIDHLWGKNVVHVWDRVFAGQLWLTIAYMHSARFFCVDPKVISCWIQKDIPVCPEISAKANEPENIACCGTRTDDTKERFASSHFPSKPHSPIGSLADGGPTQRSVSLVFTHQ